MKDERKTSRTRITLDAKSANKIINWRELVEYRDLFWFLILRDVKTLYVQSVLGIGWAIIRPVVSMIVFTVVFGNLVQVDSEGVPYAIFNFVALVPWTYFTSSLTSSTGSLIKSSAMINKVYFPRLVIPIAPVLSKLVDFAIAMLILLGMMLWFKIAPTIWTLLLPAFILLMILTAAGLGMWLTALAVQYRDVNYAIGFVVQLLIYAAPVVYSVNIIPQKYRLIYAINPMVGVIEGFRSALLGTNPIPWDLLAVGGVTAVIIAFTGVFYFSRMERVFADVA